MEKQAINIKKLQITCNFFFLYAIFIKENDSMKKILTIILDGFGMREDIYGNAIKSVHFAMLRDKK